MLKLGGLEQIVLKLGGLEQIEHVEILGTVRQILEILVAVLSACLHLWHGSRMPVGSRLMSASVIAQVRPGNLCLPGTRVLAPEVSTWRKLAGLG